MFSTVLMKILEARPERYERGMARLGRGRIAELRSRILAHIRAGQRVFEIGCGPGALTLLAAAAGARVTAIDQSRTMIAEAQRQVAQAGQDQRVELHVQGIEGLDAWPAGAFDVVLGSLVISELSPDEQVWTLGQAQRLLVPGGLLLIGDEVQPRSRAGRLLQGLARAPLAAASWLVTRQGSRPLADPTAALAAAGFHLRSQERFAGDRLAVLVAERPFGRASQEAGP